MTLWRKVLRLAKQLSKGLLLSSTVICLSLFASYSAICLDSLSRIWDSKTKYPLIMLFRLCFLWVLPVFHLTRISRQTASFKQLFSLLDSAEASLLEIGSVPIYPRSRLFLIAAGRACFVLANEYYGSRNALLILIDSYGLRSWYFLLGMILLQSLQLQFYSLAQTIDSQLGALVEGFARTESLPASGGVEQVLLVFDRLADASVILDTIYSQQALVCIGFFYISFITSAYNCFEDLKKGMALGAVVTRSSWTLFALLDILFLADKTTRISVKGIALNKLLYRMLIRGKLTIEPLQNNKIKLHFLMKRKIKFHAAGLFTIDYTMVHSILASTLVYLVVLIQMT